MKQFKIMGEAAKANRAYKFHNIADEDSQTEKMTPADWATFWTRYEQAKVFVFTPGEYPYPADDVCKRAAEDDLDVPFQTCAFEYLTLAGSAPIADIGGPKGSNLDCILLHEIAPRRYDVYAMGGKVPKICYVPWEEGKGNPLAWINILWLDRLNRSALGVEHVREKVKIGTGAQKRFHTIRQIIRVVPRKERGIAPAAFSREVDWSHRWTVRGHWVSLAGRLGKNRAGEYCVQDWTWRSEHEKGPEGAPLIHKTRFVSGVASAATSEGDK